MFQFWMLGNACVSRRALPSRDAEDVAGLNGRPVPTSRLQAAPTLRGTRNNRPIVTERNIRLYLW